MPTDIQKTQLVFEGEDRNLKEVINNTARALENLDKLASKAGKKGFASDEMVGQYKKLQQTIQDNDKKLRGFFKGATDGYTTMELAIKAARKEIEKTGNTESFDKLDKAANRFLNTLRKMKRVGGGAGVRGFMSSMGSGAMSGLSKLPGIGGMMGKMGIGGMGGMGAMGMLGMGAGALGIGALGFGASRAMIGYGRYKETLPGRLTARGRLGKVGYAGLRGQMESPELGYTPQEMLQQTIGLAPQIGGRGAVGQGRGIRETARGFGMDVGQVGDIMGGQMRAGMGVDVERTKKTMAIAVAMGMDKSRAAEYMQGILTIQQQQARFGGNQEGIREYFQAGIAATRGDDRQREFMMGQRGADLVGRISGMFKSAGMGGGDPMSLLLLRQAGLGQGENLVGARRKLQMATGQEAFGMLRGVRAQFGGGKRGKEAFELAMQEKGFTGAEFDVLNNILDKNFSNLTKDEKETYSKMLTEMKDPQSPEMKAMDSMAKAQAASLKLGERMLPVANLMRDSLTSIDGAVDGIAKVMGVETETQTDRTARTARELYKALPSTSDPSLGGKSVRGAIYKEAQKRLADKGIVKGRQMIGEEGISYEGGVSERQYGKELQDMFVQLTKLYAQGNLKLDVIADATKSTADNTGKSDNEKRGQAVGEIINREVAKSKKGMQLKGNK